MQMKALLIPLLLLSELSVIISTEAIRIEPLQRALAASSNSKNNKNSDSIYYNSNKNWKLKTGISYEPSFPLVEESSSLAIRGGARYDDEYDGYDDDDYDHPTRRPPPKRRPPPANRRNSRRPPPSNSRRPPPGRDRHPPPSRSNRRNRGPPPPSALNTAASVAKKTVDVTTAAAWGTLKGSGKAAFYLVSPKHVTRQEIWGVWRLDQSVDGVDAGDAAVCAANVELTPRGDVLVKFGADEEFATPYLFRDRKWPASCAIEFEARAFQGPHDAAPVLVKYKGCFRRKLADGNVIKIVGHIYAVKKSKWRRGDGKRIGSFVARRRLTKTRSFLDDDDSGGYDDDDDGYDDYRDDDDDGYDEWEGEEDDARDDDFSFDDKSKNDDSDYFDDDYDDEY